MAFLFLSSWVSVQVCLYLWAHTVCVVVKRSSRRSRWRPLIWTRRRVEEGDVGIMPVDGSIGFKKMILSCSVCSSPLWTVMLLFPRWIHVPHPFPCLLLDGGRTWSPSLSLWLELKQTSLAECCIMWWWSLGGSLVYLIQPSTPSGALSEMFCNHKMKDNCQTSTRKCDPEYVAHYSSTAKDISVCPLGCVRRLSCWSLLITL